MYENLPLGEVDSRVGQFARHDKEKAKIADGTEQEESEVQLTQSRCLAAHFAYLHGSEELLGFA